MDLIKQINEIKDGETLTLESGKIYSVWQCDCKERNGYYFSNMASWEENPDGMHRAGVYLKDKKDVTIDGNGATLLVHGVITPILFDGCENITLKNLTVDYKRPTMSEFFVEKRTDDGRYVIYIPEEFSYEIKGGKLVWVGEKDGNGNPFWSYEYKGDDVLSMYYDKANGQMKMMNRWGNDIRPSVPDIERIEKQEENRLFIKLKNQEDFLPVGCTVQTRRIVRNESGGCFWYCKNIRLENVKIYAMHGFGLLSQYCENITYSGVECLPKTGRTVASNADFFHFSGCKGEILIEKCKLSSGHDDFINVHGTHLQVVDYKKKEKTVILRFAHYQSWGFKAFSVGDKVEFIEWDTLLPYNFAQVVAVEKIDETGVKLTLDKEVSVKTLGKDVVENVTQTAKLTVRNNDFGTNGARGILCTTRQPILIENNSFTGVSGGALVVEDDCNFWFESGYTRDIVFKNNKISGCGYGFEGKGEPVVQITPQVLSKTSTKPVHGRLLLENNLFEKANNVGHLIKLEYIKEVTLKNNVFDQKYDIVSKNVGKIEEKGNEQTLR